MKRDARRLGQNGLAEMLVLAVQRMSEVEHPGVVATSLEMNRSWAYKCGAAAGGRGRGISLRRHFFTEIDYPDQR